MKTNLSAPPNTISKSWSCDFVSGTSTYFYDRRKRYANSGEEEDEITNIFVVVLAFTRILKSVLQHRLLQSLWSWGILQGKKHRQTKDGTGIYHGWRNSCLHQKHVLVKLGVSQRCARYIHTGPYVSLLAPGKTDYNAYHPRKTTTHILHVVPITTHTHDRRKSIGQKKQGK